MKRMIPYRGSLFPLKCKKHPGCDRYWRALQGSPCCRCPDQPFSLLAALQDLTVLRAALAFSVRVCSRIALLTQTWSEGRASRQT